MVEPETAETVRNARRQINDLLGELETLVTSDADRDQITDTMRG